MKSSVLILIALALFGLAFTATGTNAAPPVFPEKGPWNCEPVLLFDQTSEGLLAPFHTQLAVYNDGMVKYTRNNVRDEDPVVWTRHIPRYNVRELWTGLVAAGAFELEDNPVFAHDVPMSTVTIFHGKTDAMAHTFSFFVPEGRYEEILGMIEIFIIDPIG